MTCLFLLVLAMVALLSTPQESRAQGADAPPKHPAGADHGVAFLSMLDRVLQMTPTGPWGLLLDRPFDADGPAAVPFRATDSSGTEHEVRFLAAIDLAEFLEGAIIAASGAEPASAWSAVGWMMTPTGDWPIDGLILSSAKGSELFILGLVSPALLEWIESSDLEADVRSASAPGSNEPPDPAEVGSTTDVIIPPGDPSPCQLAYAAIARCHERFEAATEGLEESARRQAELLAEQRRQAEEACERAFQRDHELATRTHSAAAGAAHRAWRAARDAATREFLGCLAIAKTAFFTCIGVASWSGGLSPVVALGCAAVYLGSSVACHAELISRYATADETRTAALAAADQAYTAALDAAEDARALCRESARHAYETAMCMLLCATSTAFQSLVNQLHQCLDLVAAMFAGQCEILLGPVPEQELGVDWPALEACPCS
ncbi:MAG TPA: hypothetical protein PKC43_04705 [Phycisphaerales bacterium]|nr:hypothetical protein [Phycisphaerales bacterium]